MKNTFRLTVLLLLSSVLTCGQLLAEAPDAATQAKLDEKKPVIAAWGKDPALVSALKEFAANPPADLKGMTQEQWNQLTILDPKIRVLQTNKVGSFLKSKKEIWVAEAFVSTADGSKAGFLAKTTSWTHKGKPKHDKPVAGETWQGDLEIDMSSGKKEVQIAVPVLDGSTPIGSLVVGVDVSKL